MSWDMSDKVPRPVSNILNNIRTRELLYHVGLGLGKQITFVLLNGESFVFNTNLTRAALKQLSTTDADCHFGIFGGLSTLNETMKFLLSGNLRFDLFTIVRDLPQLTQNNCKIVRVNSKIIR